MIKIIVVAHGQFSNGILSSLELIAGKQENIVAIDFISGMSSDNIRRSLEVSLEEVEQALILTDLLGGTPFNVASTLSVNYADKEIKVLSGLNLAMLMEAVFSRNFCDKLEDLTEKLITSARNGIVDFSTCIERNEEDDQFEGGI
ncbi:PTS sugar transporter subunit IIA [Streptococcus pseudoporcinus]|uniref:PTS system, N-acetylgalactosamine-and galactosamine-specific IIA component n=1 Tax=Streptococcus pseudoporcinus TaxID=361101 RepID=A0A4U9XHQ3_9STRE|nr:PTS sugar transporter subunit IIA [Streptococcus pseudoporcinus]VTS12694.1 PTS system, N-acetylgalactosamine-and galactosamine-specific IIA component [Streptococcus pseudoporcinus]VUC65389.1 PTS system, N-acetylgalactosamine-and galactosamine-specific IIA component [Streptococcus pseudoporcinus]VUC96269.1 PTS system, N-acetylgalactosamine-and galactosamine-specific IIA component [Streptococcus pseudoporcinus]VUC96663.1 PTS system, N-acetylgalactosamine-and galactosamine-specific IIA componen